MATTNMRHKHVRIDEVKLKKAKKVLEAKTDTETLDRALSFVVEEDEINATLRRVGGKGKLVKVFR